MSATVEMLKQARLPSESLSVMGLCGSASSEKNKKPTSERNVNVKDQLIFAGELGKAAFHAGKTFAPAKDKEFMQFLCACDNRRVGMAADGAPPSLALLMAWMRCWRTEQQMAALLPAGHTTAPPPWLAAHAGL